MANAEEWAWLHTIVVNITLLGFLRRAVVATTFDTDGDAAGGEGSCCCRFRLVVIDARRCGNLTVPHDKILLHITLLSLVGRTMVATTFDADRNATGCERSYCCIVRSVVIDVLLIRCEVLTLVHITLFSLRRWRRTIHAAFAGADINRNTFQFLPERSRRRTMDTAFAAADINSDWNAFQVSLYIAFRGQEGSCQCRVSLVMIDVGERRWGEHCNTNQRLQIVARHRQTR